MGRGGQDGGAGPGADGSVAGLGQGLGGQRRGGAEPLGGQLWIEIGRSCDISISNILAAKMHIKSHSIPIVGYA